MPRLFRAYFVNNRNNIRTKIQLYFNIYIQIDERADTIHTN